MKKYLLLIFLLLLSFYSCKKAPTDAPVIETKITGKVTDGKTNSPLAGVQITTSPVTSSVNTGQDGNYTIPDIKAGQYTITAKKDGYNDNTATVTISEGQSVAADVQLIQQGAELAVSTQTLDFDVALTNLTFTITNKTKVGTVTWQVTSNQAWLKVSPSSGTTTSESDVIAVSVSRDSLNYGNYGGIISVSSDYGSQQINVAMAKQNPSAPQLTVIPTSIDFGTSNNNQTISVKNTGTGNLTWTASTSVNWIIISNTTGTTTSNNPTNISVSVNKSGYTPNNYDGLILFSSNGGNQSILVKMVVEQGTLTPPTLQLVGTPTTNSIPLGWTKNTDASFNNYKIYRSITQGVTENSTLVTTITSASQNNYTDNNLNGGTTYYYRVFVYNSNGIGSGSNEINASTKKVLGNWVATTTIPNATNISQNSLCPVSDSDGWFVFGNEIWHYDGSNWSKNFTSPDNGTMFKAVQEISQNNVWAVSSYGIIYQYNGVTWTEITSSVIGTSFLYSIVASSANDVWVSSDGKFFHYDGSQWTKYSVSAIRIVDMDLISSDNIWALDQYYGKVFHWDGTGWAYLGQANNGSASFTRIQALSNTDVWIASANSNVNGLFHYDGNEFKGDYKLPTGSTYAARNTIEMTSSNEGWSSMQSSTNLSYFDGNSWEDVTSPISHYVYCIKMLNSNDGWAVGSGGEILRYKQ
jgi:hypothetical protein